MKKKLVLMIEDDSNIRFILNRCLSTLDIDIIEAENGQIALNKLAKQNSLPDIIITDLMMPEMTGHEFIVSFKDRYPKNYVPILVLTSENDIQTKEEVLSLGGDDYIIKPFNHRDLIAKVKVLLRIKQLTDELSLKNKLLEESNKKNLELQDQLIKEEKEKTKAIVIASALHKLRQPLTNATLISGSMVEDKKNNKNLNYLKESLDQIDKILKDIESADLELTESYIDDIKILK